MFSVGAFCSVQTYGKILNTLKSILKSCNHGYSLLMSITVNVVSIMSVALTSIFFCFLSVSTNTHNTYYTENSGETGFPWGFFLSSVPATDICLLSSGANIWSPDSQLNLEYRQSECITLCGFLSSLPSQVPDRLNCPYASPCSILSLCWPFHSNTLDLPSCHKFLHLLISWCDQKLWLSCLDMVPLICLCVLTSSWAWISIINKN